MEISTSGNNAVQERERGKLIGHVMAYWRVRSPTSTVRLRYSFPCAIDSSEPPTISLQRSDPPFIPSFSTKFLEKKRAWNSSFDNRKFNPTSKFSITDLFRQFRFALEFDSFSIFPSRAISL